MAKELGQYSNGRRLPPSRTVPVWCIFCDSKFKSRQHYLAHLKTHTKEKPYFCKICSREIRGKSELTYHIKRHGDNSKNNKCNVCKRSFRLEEQLNAHMKIHSGERPFKCQICPKTFAIKSSLTVHVKGHNQNLHECKQCFRRFKLEQHLKQHIQSVHEMSPTQQCPICNKTLSNSTPMHTHMLIHTGEKPHKCQYCRNAYKYPETLKRHLAKIHSAPTQNPLKTKIREVLRPFECPKCPKKFENQLYLTRHMFTHTHRKKNYSCEICRLAFQTPEKLRLHGFHHSAKVENGLAICPVCEKGFTDNRQLMRHVRALHNNVMHECDVCQKRFKDQNYLKKHMTRHTQEKSYKCGVCGTGFKSNNNRKAHEQTHLRKEHKCDICDAEYHQPANLRNHVKRVHGKEKHFECLFCTKRFFFNADLMSHLQIHTGEKPNICWKCHTEFSCSKSLKHHVNNLCVSH